MRSSKKRSTKSLEKFQDARAERDLQSVYLETVVRHVPVPFVAVRGDGTLSLVNNSLRRLTGLPSIRTLEGFVKIDPDLPQKMRAIPSGEQQLLQTRLHGVPVELRVSVSEIRLEGDVERLYSFENLSGELTAREASAWRNLIRVLTHEIMNTLTPVTSLATSAEKIVDDPDARSDLREAIQTIARRSEGLTSFVRRYREVLNVPKPVIASVCVADALKNLATLLREESAATVSVDVAPETLSVNADATLLDQVLLNIGKNAVHATADVVKARIDLRATLRFGRVAIEVSDNGSGIDADLQDQVFVPFFTTKRNGSGIGLSLSKQIMSAHGGEIAVDSGKKGTRITLIF